MPKGEKINDNYHLGQLNKPVSQIDIQRNMVGFVVEGHILTTLYHMHRGGSRIFSMVGL